MHGHNTANKTKSKFVVYACSYKVQKKGAIVLPSGGNTPEQKWRSFPPSRYINQEVYKTGHKTAINAWP